MPTTTTTDIIISTAKALNEALKQTNRNPLLPPYDAITHKTLSQIYYIFSDASSAIKSQLPPILKFQGCPLQTLLLYLQLCLHLSHKFFIVSSQTTQKIAEIFELSNPKLPPKHHILLLHRLNSSPILAVSLAILKTLMLPSQR